MESLSPFLIFCPMLDLIAHFCHTRFMIHLKRPRWCNNKFIFHINFQSNYGDVVTEHIEAVINSILQASTKVIEWGKQKILLPRLKDKIIGGAKIGLTIPLFYLLFTHSFRALTRRKIRFLSWVVCWNSRKINATKHFVVKWVSGKSFFGLKELSKFELKILYSA